jgi:Na+-driven multidrug efflux pump
VPLGFVLVAYWLVALPVALTLGFGWWSGNPMGIDGFWVGLGTGLLFVTVTLNLRRARLAQDEVRIEILADRSE